MEPRANHVLIGAFTLLGVALLIAGGLWSARWASEQAWQYYEVHFPQPVSGLSVGSVVQYNGINMGSVRDLYLASEDPSRVVALIRLSAEAPVREDTTARLAVSGLTGVSTIQLRGGQPDSPPLEPPPGADHARIVAEESALQRLLETSEDIATTASKVMLRLLEFLSEDNAERVAMTLDNIDRFTTALSGESALIEETVRNVHAGSAQLDQAVTDIRALVAEVTRVVGHLDSSLSDTVPEVSADLRETMQQLARTAERIDRMVARNESAVAAFGDQVLVPLGPAVDELRLLLLELSQLTRRFERHPVGFLLGDEQPEEYRPQ